MITEIRYHQNEQRSSCHTADLLDNLLSQEYLSRNIFGLPRASTIYCPKDTPSPATLLCGILWRSQNPAIWLKYVAQG